jgi:hypothetical protein
MRSIRRLVLASMMKVWLISRQIAYQSTPRPTDAPNSSTGGLDGHWVLIFGSGPAIGWGVLSHEIALPGSLARALSSRTGRGTTVDVVADTKLNADGALSVVRKLNISKYNAIVVILGPNDAAMLTALPRWRKGLSAVLDYLGRSEDFKPLTIVTGVPPLQGLPGLGSKLAAIADTHAREMNRATEGLCRRADHATFVPLSSGLVLDSRVPDGRTYRYWASEIAVILAA